MTCRLNQYQWRHKISIRDMMMLTILFALFRQFRVPFSKLHASEPWDALVEIEETDRISGNAHGHFPRVCGAPVFMRTIHPGTGPLYQKMEDLNSGTDMHMHILQQGSLDEKLEKLINLQVCMYSSLERWTKLAMEHNLTRWAAIAGTMIGAKCYQSMNPWDDDIDIMVLDCEKVGAIHAKATPIPSLSHTRGDWTYEAKDLDDDWIISKFYSTKQHWYKLKSKAQLTVVPTKDTSGIDILCLYNKSPTESEPMRNSKYTEYLQSNKPLDILTFGPTTIQVVPPHITDKYIWKRFGNRDPCNLHGLYPH